MNLDASKATLIGIDWGTSSLRAYLIGADGSVLTGLSDSKGILAVPNKDFDAVLSHLLHPWLQNSRAQNPLVQNPLASSQEIPIVASGMITSRNGWLETPYLQLPAGATALANAMESRQMQSGLAVHFITGLSTESGSAEGADVNFNGESAPDVMRGEETQIAGVIESGHANATMVLPGTHSKWVNVRGGFIDDFATFMSGEIFAALREHTILGTLMKEGGFNKQGFQQGVTAGFNAGPQLLHRLFHVRTLPLFNLISEDQVADYLSGLLIGSEISGATDKGFGNDLITVVGSGALADRYMLALELLNQKANLAAEDIVAAGHFAIAKSAGLIK